MVARLLVLPTALTGALFPALAQAHGRGAGEARALRSQAMRLTVLLVLPAALLGGLFAAPLLRLWLGDDFAANGSAVMQILLVGFAFNALAQIPMVALHGHGMARATATLHLIELPVYVVVLYALVSTRGLEGAALAWSARGALDFFALSLMLRRTERAAPERAVMA